MKKIIITALLFCSLNTKSQTPLCDSLFTMPLRFENVSGNIKNGNVNINFNVQDQTGIKKYIIMVSYDGNTFVNFKEVQPAYNKFIYTLTYNL
jgi:hypothetical protein